MVEEVLAERGLLIFRVVVEVESTNKLNHKMKRKKQTIRSTWFLFVTSRAAAA